MNTRDNIQAELQVLRMENVCLTNELAKRNEYARFLEDENEAMAVTSGKNRNGMDDSAKKKTNRPKVRVPKQKTDKSKPSSDTESNTPCRRCVYTATILEEMGIDTSNLPKGSKLIKRKDKVTGEDMWYIQLFFHTPAKVTCREYKIGRFNVPKSDPMCSKRPVRI